MKDCSKTEQPLTRILDRTTLMTHSVEDVAGRAKLTTALRMPSNFLINEVPARACAAAASVADNAPPLGPLRAFSGTFAGRGFNVIFRPQNPSTPTQLDQPRPDSDNILELNLTTETLAFPDPGDDHPLGAVPNRGAEQGDIFLGGVRYLQAISDVTTDPARPTPIHLEPGLWMIVAPTQHPSEAQPTVARMASIPHGTTLNAVGTFIANHPGGPKIDPVDITPFVTGNPAKRVHFDSQDIGTTAAARIPQDLSRAPGITQELLDDPNSLLRNHISGLRILSTDVIIIDTKSAVPGGGISNIGFLLGDDAGPNAEAVEMSATFWIETVQTQIQVGPLKAGEVQEVSPEVPAGAPAPRFLATATAAIPDQRMVTVQHPQIQYTQNVSLNFKKLTWPHVSVATLVPSKSIPVQV